MLVDLRTFASICEKVSKYDTLAVDTETNGLQPFKESCLIGISICTPDMEAFYFPFRHFDEKVWQEDIGKRKPKIIEKRKIIPFSGNLDENHLKELVALLSQPRTYIYHNAKFDIQMLYREGVKIPSKIEDTMLAAHLLNENEDSLGLKPLADKYVGAGSSAEKEILEQELAKRKLKKGEMYLLPVGITAAYAAKDAEITFKLRNFQLPHIKEWKLEQLYNEVCDYSLTICRMEINGILLDMKKVEENYIEAGKRAESARLKIQQLAGKPINPASPMQLKEWLGLPDTSAKTLDEADSDREDINLVKEFRAWIKVQGTYYLAFREMVDTNNVLHCNFRMTGTISGRLSCSSPNLQAIPRQPDAKNMTGATEAKLKVKECFISRPGCTLIEADFSQLELRLAAELSNDATMRKAFDENLDLHQITADATGLDRMQGKTLNFSILYGAGANKLSGMLKISKNEAYQSIQSYFKQYPGIQKYNIQLQKTASANKYLRIFSGRVRHFFGIEDEMYKAMNNCLQASGAELTRIAIQKLEKELTPIGVKLLLQVHDSVLLEVPDQIVGPICRRVKEIMEITPEKFTVPLKVDIKVGKSLGNMSKYERNKDI